MFEDEPNRRSTPRDGATPRDGIGPGGRIDEESLQKFDEIVEILVAGGYFRARITALTPFDKVVGGMAWSITASNVDVDVDIFFQENSSIGQKIKLSEKLIEALHKMKCPFPLQAQQIQGLDYINLFPIIQWLIKKVIEVREETGDLTRMYSESQFNKSFKFPHDLEFDKRRAVAVEYVHSVADRYKVQRRFKRQKTSVPTVQATLLEYGKLNRLTRAPADTKKPMSEAAAKVAAALGGSGANDQMSDDAAAEEERIRAMMKTLDTVGDTDKVSGAVVGAFMTSEQIQQIASRYEDQASAGGTAGAGQMLVAEKQHKTKIANLEKQIDQQKHANATVRVEHEEKSKEAEEIQAQCATKAAFNERIVAEIKKLDQLETPQNTKQLQLLRNLVALNDSLRVQETLFKANCKRQMLQLNQQIEELKKDRPDDSDRERKKLVEETFTADSDKLKKIKQLSAKKNRDIAAVERKIDEVPSRIELMQYQRQFVELYEQVSAKLTETRQYYSTYNTLEDTRSVLAREVSILNSIHDNYKTAMSSKSMRDKLLESLGAIVQGVSKNLEKEDDKMAKEKKTSDDLNDKYLKLVEKERSYYKATKEFQEECRKNETLSSRLAQ